MAATLPHTNFPPPPDESDREQDGADARMGFLEHLDELRKRIIRSFSDTHGAPLRLIVTGAVIENAWARRKRARVQSRVNLG